MQRKKRHADFLRILALIIVFMLIIYIWLFIFMPRGIPSSLMLMVPESKLNLLIIGKDYSYDELHNVIKKNRSDTLILAQVNPYIGKITLISVPRDSFVEIPGKGFHKINEAYWHGKEDLVKKTASNIFGINITGYMTIDPKGLVKLVDSLGGVTFYVEKNMKYDDSWGGLHIDLKKGKQKLSGKAFEGYVRFRHDSEGDVARVKRQQTALKQILKKLSSPIAIVRLPWMVPAIKTSLDTDISFPDLLRIANFTRTLSPSDIRTFTLPGSVKYGDPHWYIDPAQIQSLLKDNKII